MLPRGRRGAGAVRRAGPGGRADRLARGGQVDHHQRAGPGATRGAGHAGRRARGRPVQPVHRRGDPRRPGPDAGPRHRPGRLHPVDVQPGPPRRAGRGDPAGGPGAGGRRLRRGAGRDRRRRPGRGGGGLAGRHHAGAARARAWATRSRRSRPASWRSPTSSWSTRPTGTAPTPPYRDIQGMIALGERGPGEWRPQVVRAVAARGEGIDDIVAAIDKHRAWLDEHGQLRRRRETRAAAEIEAIALGTLRARIGSLRDGTALPTLAAQVAAGAPRPVRGGRRTARPDRHLIRLPTHPERPAQILVALAARATDPGAADDGRLCTGRGPMDHEATQGVAGDRRTRWRAGRRRSPTRWWRRSRLPPRSPCPGWPSWAATWPGSSTPSSTRSGWTRWATPGGAARPHVTNGAAVVNLVLVIAAGHPVPQVTDAVRAAVIEQPSSPTASRADRGQHPRSTTSAELAQHLVTARRLLPHPVRSTGVAAPR